MSPRIVEDDLEEVRRRSDLVEVVSGYLNLKKAGRVFKGLCCFHQEKTPSFTVDPDKQLFHCFGCGAGGDVFTFLRQLEGLSFDEAAQRLADRAGVSLRHEGMSGKEGGSRRYLLAVNQAAASYFSDLLWQSPEAQGARHYVESRGFSSEDAKTWGLGFAPSGNDTAYRRLLAQKFTDRQILDAGLAMLTEGGQHRDRFRRRLMFPVRDVAGEVVGFGARALGDEQPKYLNSPETPLYRKSRILYGLDRAKMEMVRGGFAVVTEGYTDVMALHKIGIANAVATCGTALGEEHFTAIKRFCDRAILAFDADAAGAIASERGFGIHARAGLEVLIALLPEGQDPADAALASGEPGFRAILDSAVPLMRFVLDKELSRHRLDTAEAKAKAVRDVSAILAAEPNRVVRSEHAFWLGKRIGVDPQQVMLELAERGGPARSRNAPQAFRMPGNVRLEREALAMLMGSPSLVDDAAVRLSEEHFTQPLHRVLFKALIDSRKPGGGARPMDLLPDDDSRRLAAELALAPNFGSDADEVFRRLEKLRLAGKIDSLRTTLNRTEGAADGSGSDEVFDELMRLEELRRGFED